MARDSSDLLGDANYWIDEDGNLRSKEGLYVFGVMARDADGNFYDPTYDEESLSNEKWQGKASPFKKHLESFYGGGLSPEEIAKEAGSEEAALNELMLALLGDTGNDETEKNASYINALAKKRDLSAVYLKNPGLGFLLIGNPDKRFSVVKDSDLYYDGLEGKDTRKGKKIRDAFRRIHNDYGGVLEGARSPLMSAIMDDLSGSWMFNNVLTDSDREMISSARDFEELRRALAFMDDENVKNAIAEGKSVREALEEAADRNSAYLALKGYVPDDEGSLFESDDLRFRELMYDKLVEAIARDFRKKKAFVNNPYGLRLVMFSLPAKNILSNKELVKGIGRPDRDTMNSIAVEALIDPQEVGSEKELFGEGGAMRDYLIRRLAKERAWNAFERTLGDKLGIHAENIGSDREIKEIHNGVARGIEPLLRQSFITQGIMRGL